MVLDPNIGARFERDVDKARKSAIGALAALGIDIAGRVFSMALKAWELGLVREAKANRDVDLETLRLSDGLVRFGQIAQWPLSLMAGLLFIHWLWIVVRLTRELGGGVRWKPSDALWAFVIPFVNMWEPYQVLRDVTRALAPERVPEPPLRLEPDGSAGYRGGRLVIPPPRLELPVARIGVWWASCWLASLPAWVEAVIVYVATVKGDRATHFESELIVRMVADGSAIVSAVFAIQMVRAVAARLAERFRRIQHSPVHVLLEAGIGPPSTETPASSLPE